MESSIARAVRNALAIRGLPGVVGVFWGTRCRQGRWHPGEAVLSVHVRRKRDERHLASFERIPPEVDGMPTDVLEVGRAAVHTLSHEDPIHGSRQRRSTITAIARHDGRGYVLTCGHGVLPYGAGGIQHVIASASLPVALDDDGVTVAGLLRQGAFGEGRPVDYAIVEVAGSVSTDDTHGATEGAAPHLLRSGPLRDGEQLRCRSPNWLRGTMCSGTVVGNSLSDVELDLPDGRRTGYARVVTLMASSATPFSEPGDSGSLVVDSARRAVGLVLGGAGSISYVLRLDYLRSSLGNLFSSFFRGGT